MKTQKNSLTVMLGGWHCGDVRDLQAIADEDFKKEMVGVTENELRIQTDAQTNEKFANKEKDDG
jgi:hypothetical protein